MAGPNRLSPNSVKLLSQFTTTQQTEVMEFGYYSLHSSLQRNLRHWTAWKWNRHAVVL